MNTPIKHLAAIAATILSVHLCSAQPAPGGGASNNVPPQRGPGGPGGGPGRGFGRRGGGAAADQPAPRTDANSQLAHQQLLEKAKKGGIDIYFEGDSITRRWGTSDAAYKSFLANWTSNFFGWNAADFGWGADTIQNILWRLDNGELDGVNPKIIVLLAGINNVNGSGDAEVTNITKGLQAVVKVCQEKAPNATIIMTGIFPGKGANGIRDINKINDNLSQMADGKKLRYINVNAKLEDANGNQDPALFVDGLHPKAEGYQIWADALKPIFTEILGPPAKTDHAPAPTGDPSASRPAAVNPAN